MLGCAAVGPPSTATPVSGEEVISLIRGKMLRSENNLGTTSRNLVRPDLTATLVMITRDGRVLRDTGRVRAADDRVCWTWEELRDGSEYCARVVRQGDRFWSIYEGDGQITSFLIRPASEF